MNKLKIMPKNSNTDPKPQCVQTDVSSSAHPLMVLMKKYHNCGMELRERRELVTDVQDITVIDLQILTNERFLTDLTALAVAIL